RTWTAHTGTNSGISSWQRQYRNPRPSSPTDEEGALLLRPDRAAIPDHGGIFSSPAGLEPALPAPRVGRASGRALPAQYRVPQLLGLELFHQNQDAHQQFRLQQSLGLPFRRHHAAADGHRRQLRRSPDGRFGKERSRDSQFHGFRKGTRL